MTFERAIAMILPEEGGLSMDPNDPGNYTPAGELKGTNFGISARSYPDEDIANMTRERAMELYRRDRWDEIGGDALPWPLCLFVLDASINQGVGAAIKMLQMALKVTPDGIIGPDTLAAINHSTQRHAARFMAFRCNRYAGTRGFENYGIGWMTRCFWLAMEA